MAEELTMSGGFGSHTFPDIGMPISGALLPTAGDGVTVPLTSAEFDGGTPLAFPSAVASPVTEVWEFSPYLKLAIPVDAFSLAVRSTTTTLSGLWEGQPVNRSYTCAGSGWSPGGQGFLHLTLWKTCSDAGGIGANPILNWVLEGQLGHATGGDVILVGTASGYFAACTGHLTITAVISTPDGSLGATEAQYAGACQIFADP